MVEFAHTQSLEKSIDTQMNFGECILGYPLSFRGTYIIPTKEPAHRIILETMSIETIMCRDVNAACAWDGWSVSWVA